MSRQTTDILQRVKQDNRQWFSGSNMRLLGDKSYTVRHGESGKVYLVRLTDAWTDMFGDKPTRHYRVNELSLDGEWKIGKLFDDVLKNQSQVTTWLRGK